MNNSNNLKCNSIIDILPITLVLIYFSGIDKFYDLYSKVNVGHNPIRQLLLGLSYFVAIIIVFRNLNKIVLLIRNISVYFLFLIFLLLSSLWSLFPLKVVLNFVHGAGLTLVILSGVCYIEENEKKFIALMVIISVISVVFSFYISKYFPEFGVTDTSSWGKERLRWTGLYRYPNSLGLMCIIAIWAIVSSYYTIEGILLRFIGLIGLIFSSLTLFYSNSVTSILCSIFTIVSFPILMLFRKKGSKKGFIATYAFIFILPVILAILYLNYPQNFSQDYFFNKIGRKSNFTHRDIIWKAGFEAFKRKPILGWGYDSMLTLNTKKFAIGVLQYHNGYLNSLIQGGVISLFIFVIILLRTLFITAIIFKAGKKEISISYFIFVMTMLIRNITESTLFRSVNYMWFVFLLFWFYFEYLSLNYNKAE